jgi:hypothetical protein
MVKSTDIKGEIMRLVNLIEQLIELKIRELRLASWEIDKEPEMIAKTKEEIKHELIILKEKE